MYSNLEERVQESLAVNQFLSPKTSIICHLQSEAKATYERGEEMEVTIELEYLGNTRPTPVAAVSVLTASADIEW